MIIIEGLNLRHEEALIRLLIKDFGLGVDTLPMCMVERDLHEIVYSDFKASPFVIYQGHEIIRRLVYTPRGGFIEEEITACWRALYLILHTQPLIIHCNALSYDNPRDITNYRFLMESINSHNPVSNPVVYYDGSEDAYEKGVKPRVRKYLDHHASIPRVSLPTIFP